MSNQMIQGLLASIVGLGVSAWAFGAPVVGNLPADPQLDAALGTSVGQLAVNEGGNAWVGEISPSVYQAYNTGASGQPPILVAVVSTQTPTGSNNAVFTSLFSTLSLNGGAIATGMNMGGIGSFMPNQTNYVAGFSAFDFYTATDPTFQNGANTGIVVFQANPAIGSTNTTLADATVTLGTFYLDNTYALGTLLDVFVVNPGAATDPGAVTYNTLANFTPEPASLTLLGMGTIGMLIRRPRSA